MNNKMNNRTIILLLLTCVFAIVIGGIRSKKEELTFLEMGIIEKVVIEKEGSDRRKELIDEEKKEFLNALIKDSNLTKTESINDFPVNVEDYLKVTVYRTEKQDNEDVFFVYKRGDYTSTNYYLEKPYEGIWELSEDTYQKTVDMYQGE